MNTSEILQMIEKLKETGFNHIDVTHEGSHILLSNAEFAGSNLQASQAHQMATYAPNQSQPIQSQPLHTNPVQSGPIAGPTSQVETKTSLAEEVIEKPVITGGHLVESPIVGTFYAAAGPDTDDFVQVGSKVAKGDVLCIIEAMKLMNEIEADQSGEIAEILVANEDGVEYGQPLFRII